MKKMTTSVNGMKEMTILPLKKLLTLTPSSIEIAHLMGFSMGNSKGYIKLQGVALVLIEMNYKLSYLEFKTLQPLVTRLCQACIGRHT